MSEPRASLVGQTFGGCRVESLLGQGALGAVYRAHQVSLDRAVAIKVLTASSITKEHIKELFNEAKTLAKMNHPNVVKVFDVGVAGNQPYIVMEHLEGETLQKRLDRAVRLPFEAVLKLATEIATGLHAAHQVGIVHRDLKPSNVFLRPSQKLKLIDFGLAHHVAGEKEGVQQSGGTPEYMAPEQWTFKTVDGRTDLYALGILIFRMISGKVPFTATSLDVMMHKHLKEPLPSEGFSSDSRAADLYPIVKMLTLKEPDRRYANAEALLRDLAKLSKGEKPGAAAKYAAPKLCPVCETANAPSAETCTGCNSSLTHMNVDIDSLLPPEEPPKKQKRISTAINPRNLRRRPGQ
jgi:serine/threonine-protein kinase